MKSTDLFFSRPLSRRDFIMTAGGIVISASALGLIGCGGGGVSTTAAGMIGSMQAFTGQVATVPGLSQTGLVVAAGLNTTSIKSGKFSATAPSDAPSLVTVTNPATNAMVFMAMYDPTIGGTLTVDSNSTAIAYLFFALGGATMSRDGQKPVLDAIKANGATSTFAAVVAARMAANAAPDDPQLVAALSTAAKAIAPTIAMPSVRARPADVPALLLLQPSGEVNGVTFVQQSTSGVGFQVQNVKRRNGYVYTYLTGHVDQTGAVTAVSPPVQVGNPLEVPSTTSLLNLSSGWHPTTSAAVPLSLQGTDKQTQYQMVFLAPIYGATNPAFFSDPMWSAEVSKWNQSLGTLCQDTFVSYIANILFSALGFGGLTWLHAELAAAVANLTAIPSVSTLLAQAAGEDVLLGDLANFTLKQFIAGDISQALLKDVGILLRSASAQAAATLEAGALSATLLAAIQVAVATFLAVGVFALAADIAAVAIDTSVGDRGDLFSATVVQQTLILSPQNPSVAPGARVTFSVKPPTGLAGTLQYTWTQTSNFATLSAADGTVGNSITTTSTSVDLVTTGSDSAPITVTVVGYQVVNGVKTEFGTAQTVVAVSNGTTVQSSRVIVLKNNPDNSGRQFIFEFNTFPIVPGAKKYVINGATLYDYQLARGAPAVDTGVDTNMNFVSYQIPTDGSMSFYNVGGQIGFLNPEIAVEGGGWYPGNAIGDVGPIISGVEAEPNPIVTITM